MREITSVEELEACLEQSHGRPVFLFKHSTRCPISAVAMDRLSDHIADPPSDCPEVLLVNVVESRAVSNEIAKRLAVRHQSPQLILVKGGEALWITSHSAIHGDAIDDALHEHLGGG
jgi:bacillithiol system protein YtxJ